MGPFKRSDMRRGLVVGFVYSAGVILAVTAMAKIVSACGHAGILRKPDPILRISFQHLLLLVAVLELTIALTCFFNKRMRLNAALVAWLATGFLVYRLGSGWIGGSKPCGCLGNLTDALHLPPQIVDATMKIILAYLLVGNYGILYWLWRQSKRPALRFAASVDVKDL